MKIDPMSEKHPQKPFEEFKAIPKLEEDKSKKGREQNPSYNAKNKELLLYRCGFI